MTTATVDLDLCAWERYASGTLGADFAWWAEQHLVQSVDQFAGMPLILEPWQLAFFSEALALDEDGTPYWKLVVLVVPRKNSKTTMLAGYGLYQLEQDGQPEVLLTASSDKQAGRLFDGAVSFVRRSPYLSAKLHLREYIGEIARVDGGGKMMRMASDPARAHGYNPSTTVSDELHGWVTPALRRLWAAQQTAGAARRNNQRFAISTAGEAASREDSILGQIIDRNERDGELERPHAGLTISRNHKARTIVFNYSAPTKDPRDIPSMKLANPASWVTEDYLLEQASNPALSDAEVLQLHGCVWADTDDLFVDPDVWASLEADEEIPSGSPVVLGVDVALVGDTTAIATAWDRPGLPLVEAEAWSAVRGVVADHYVEGGRIDLEEIERAIVEKAERFDVQAVVYDPRFFERSALLLEREHGLLMVPLDQASKLPEAAQEFWVGVRDGAFRWRGESRTLSAHVLATAAEKTDKGWRVRKVKQSKRIDAAVAAMMALFMVGEVGAGGFEWAD